MEAIAREAINSSSVFARKHIQSRNMDVLLNTLRTDAVLPGAGVGAGVVGGGLSVVDDDLAVVVVDVGIGSPIVVVVVVVVGTAPQSLDVGEAVTQEQTVATASRTARPVTRPQAEVTQSKAATWITAVEEHWQP